VKTYRMPPLYVRDDLFSCYVKNPLVAENTFLAMTPDDMPVPDYAASRALLPDPHWSGHGADIDCYWKAWELAFGNLGRPTPENGFVSSYIDTAFNGHLFLWDSAFILMFGRYGSRAFNFQRTLDNFYAKQHPDGFICREIDMVDGQDCFHRHDPSSTGPNVLPWSEWEYYLNFGDRDRLARTFPVLLAYHRWLRDYRTWPDGSYWSCGWACGMDNQPRVPRGYSPAHSPAHQTWADACFHAILSARLLLQTGRELGRQAELADLEEEIDRLSHFADEQLWHEPTAFYYDRRRDGSLASGIRTVGAYWALLADVVRPDRLNRFIAHLEDPRQFNRPHRVPSLSAEHPAYRADGDYWCGGVWPSTQYMILRGLTHVGHDRLAHEIACNHVENVTRVFQETGTLWENYAPEKAAPGNPARPDFVGWGGLAPITVLFEYVFGLRPNVPTQTLTWDVRLLDAHGVDRYPWGQNGALSLHCAARRTADEQPVITVKSNTPLAVEIHWADQMQRIEVPGR
jgi:hypothetical protein